MKHEKINKVEFIQEVQMKTFIIAHGEKQESKNKEKLDLFIDNVIKQLQEYGVEYVIVNAKNCEIIKRSLNKDALVVVCNEHNIGCKFQEAFLKKALEEQAEIWPVAIDKDNRIPIGIISKKQSYDVWEQLRCRNLDELHISAIAMSFSRKIISKAYPMLYNEAGEIFISHRRLDGEEITARIYDRIKIQAENANPFRDVVKVKVGDEAQQVIEEAMKNSEVFVFVHTDKAAESEWIIKELRFALMRNIPILWIQIDSAEVKKLKIKPSENPHLHYTSEDFEDEDLLVKIADEILQKSFELIMANSNKVFDYVDSIETLFGSKICNKNQKEMIYHVSVPRKGYHYPQRKIEQYFQIIGRTPTTRDVNNLRDLLCDFNGDSIVILSNKVVSPTIEQDIIIDSIEDFYYYWYTYLYGNKESGDMKEIIVSGAFPDCEEVYKQSLTDALIIFAKAIMKSGYVLTFGAHPTFQELFFEIARNIGGQDSRNMLKMFISNWFLEKECEKEEYYNSNCQLIKCEKMENLNNSLSVMRKKMIQRKEVKALVCLGGKIKENKKEEGVREEIDLAIEYDIPVFIVGSVGGCSAEVAKEYMNDKWKDLNTASKELNEKFLNSINYLELTQSLIKYIEHKEE